MPLFVHLQGRLPAQRIDDIQEVIVSEVITCSLNVYTLFFFRVALEVLKLLSLSGVASFDCYFKYTFIYV